MSKRKPLDKAQARERRNKLLESAAAAELSLTDGVREMRAIAGMTQEEFAKHRGVSARVIKAIELGQGNPTVATLNRIGQFFGLEVAFVPTMKRQQESNGTTTVGTQTSVFDMPSEAAEQLIKEAEDRFREGMEKWINTLFSTERKALLEELGQTLLSRADPSFEVKPPKDDLPHSKNKKPLSSK